MRSCKTSHDLADDVLLTTLKRLTGTSNELTAQLLAHLAEVEARGIHRNMACATLCSYCVYELRTALCGPVRRLPQGNGRGEAPVGALAELELADESSVPSPSSLPEAAPLPPPPMHYKVQFTADQQYIELLEDACDLLAHVNPTRDIVEVQRRAL